jgi:hypothetical protein
MAFASFNHTHPPSTNDLILPIVVASIAGLSMLIAVMGLIVTYWVWIRNAEQPAPVPTPVPAPAPIELGPHGPHS